MTLCSPVTHRIMRARYGYRDEGEVRALPLREPVGWEGWEVRLLPAGHIIGSAMLHLTRAADGATLLYTGDFKLRPGLSSEPCELRPADTLVMECTFGLPAFRFPPAERVIADLLRFVRETLDDGGIPVLLGYSLGKAQEILRALAGAGHPVMVHRSIWDLTRTVAPLLGPLPDYRLFDPAEAPGHVLLFPPASGRSVAIRRLKVCRTALLTGWALQSGARFRHQVDEVFPLSDHADHPELIETVETVKPRLVWLVHGSTRAFAAELRARGHDAWTLDGADQLELSLPPGPALPLALDDSGPEAPEDWGEGSFVAWARTCDATAEIASRLRKVERLADFLAPLAEPDLRLAATFSTGATGDPPLHTGWSIVKRALIEAAGLTEADYRAISRSQSDAGRTAYLILRRAPLAPGACDLADIAALFDRLRRAGSQGRRVSLVKERLLGLGARAGSWLVRLLIGELRMGSREGLIEEAIAAAFGREAEAVREAAMRCGDLAAAAVLAKAGRLHEAQPRPLVPIKVMLASPEETAQAIRDRLTDPDLWLEDKFDGIRAQAHRQAGAVGIYSRDLKPLAGQFPEIARALAGLTDDLILDGEIIAHAEGKQLTFFDLQKRLGRRDQADLFLPSDVSVQYVVFDLLWRNGRSLLSEPLAARRAELEGVPLPDGMRLIEVRRAADTAGIEAAFLAARRRGNEGLIAKDASSPYTPGRRGKAWLKLKKGHATLDVVVVKAGQGHGKRGHLLSDYTFAVRDEAAGDALRVIGKAYSGLTDAEIEELTEHFTRTTVSLRGRVRTVVPGIVLEIAFDSIQPSDRHDSGLAMRFPRIQAIRRDKSPAEIDTLAEARRLAGIG